MQCRILGPRDIAVNKIDNVPHGFYVLVVGRQTKISKPHLDGFHCYETNKTRSERETDYFILGYWRKTLLLK